MPKFEYVNAGLEPNARTGLVPWLFCNRFDANFGIIGAVAEFDEESSIKTVHVASDKVFEDDGDAAGEDFAMRAGAAAGTNQVGGSLYVRSGLGTGSAATSRRSDSNLTAGNVW